MKLDHPVPDEPLSDRELQEYSRLLSIEASDYAYELRQSFHTRKYSAIRKVFDRKLEGWLEREAFKAGPFNDQEDYEASNRYPRLHISTMDESSWRDTFKTHWERTYV